MFVSHNVAPTTIRSTDNQNHCSTRTTRTSSATTIATKTTESFTLIIFNSQTLYHLSNPHYHLSTPQQLGLPASTASSLTNDKPSQAQLPSGYSSKHFQKYSKLPRTLRSVCPPHYTPHSLLLHRPQRPTMSNQEDVRSSAHHRPFLLTPDTR